MPEIIVHDHSNVTIDGRPAGCIVDVLANYGYDRAGHVLVEGIHGDLHAAIDAWAEGLRREHREALRSLSDAHAAAIAERDAAHQSALHDLDARWRTQHEAHRAEAARSHGEQVATLAKALDAAKADHAAELAALRDAHAEELADRDAARADALAAQKAEHEAAWAAREARHAASWKAQQEEVAKHRKRIEAHEERWNAFCATVDGKAVVREQKRRRHEAAIDRHRKALAKLQASPEGAEAGDTRP